MEFNLSLTMEILVTKTNQRGGINSFCDKLNNQVSSKCCGFTVSSHTRERLKKFVYQCLKINFFLKFKYSNHELKLKFIIMRWK